jgi:hypothetical protein
VLVVRDSVEGVRVPQRSHCRTGAPRRWSMATTPGSTPAARAGDDNGTVPADGGPPLAADWLRLCAHRASATDIELARAAGALPDPA